MEVAFVEKVLVIPATFVVGESFPANLPLADGSVKPLAACSKNDVREAVEELRAVVESSRNRLQRAYEEHVEDLEVFAQLSAYLDRYDEWSGLRDGTPVKQTIWSVENAKGAPERADL
jgi:hypothetical protein